VNTDDMCLSADGQCLRKLPKSAAPGYLLDGLRSMIQELRGRGRRVIVTLPFPVFDRSVPDVEIHNALFGAAFGKIALAEYPLDEMRNRLISLARDTGADIFDPRASLCDRLGCTYQIDGVSIYLGTDHIAASQAGILKANLIRTLSAQ
jgi:hypothetical protein